MLAKRVILSLCTVDGRLVRTKWFKPDRFYTLNYVDFDLADEILLLDVTRGGRSLKYWETVERLTESLFLPLTLGGHMTCLEDVSHALKNGADKVLFNTAVFRDPDLIERVARRHGNQALVVGIDVKDGQVVIDQGREQTGRSFIDWARECESRGAGEILLNDTERDGSLRGYNLENLDALLDAVNIPVISVGGCGGWRHMDEAFTLGATGAATSVIHHLTPAHLETFKTNLRERHPIR